MPNKKNATQITAYYQQEYVVEGYDDRRFAGEGGAYIHDTEVNTTLSLMKKSLRANSLVLDLGAGRGRLTQPLVKAKFQVFALERSEAMISYLSKIVKRSQIFHQSIFDPIKAKKPFSGINSLRFFDHFNLKDQGKILKNIQTVLEPNGRIYISALNKHSSESLLSRFFPYGRYNFFYSIEEYQTLFAKAGLVETYRTSAFFLPRGFFLYAQKIPGLVAVLQVIDRVGLKLLPQYGSLVVFEVRLI